MKKHIVIISPALANANNGNWQTAWRWSRMLRHRFRVSLLAADAEIALTSPPALVIALHARRCAAALANVSARFPRLPTILVLTGTDLYRDIREDESARRSLQLATRLVVLQEAGLRELDAGMREKARVIYQSAPALQPIPQEAKARMRHFEVCMIGHLRDEKDPATFIRAAALIKPPKIRLTHIGSNRLDPALGRMAMQAWQEQPNYRWLGDVPHAATRQRLKRSHLMVIASKLEGGANVIIEAVTCGVPVLASDIAGNRGMLGDDYAGYFPVGDCRTLAELVERAAGDPQFYARLAHQCQTRAPLFAPDREQAAVWELVDNTLLQKT